MTVIPAKSYVSPGQARPRLNACVDAIDVAAVHLRQDAGARDAFLKCPASFLAAHQIEAAGAHLSASCPPGKEGLSLGINFGVAINAVAYFNVAVDLIAAYTAFVVCRWGWIGCDDRIYYNNQFKPDQPWDGGESYAV